MYMTKLELPPIALSDLPEATKDYILGLCNGSDLTPEEVVRRVLNNAALPFMPPPAASMPVETSEARAA